VKDRAFVVVALALSFFTSAILHLNHVDVVQIGTIVFLENIFLLLLHVYTYVRGEDPYLGKAAREIRGFRDALPHVSSILKNTVAVLSTNNDVIKGKGLECLNEVNSSLARLSAGEIEIDLRPGGAFFRELHAGDHARNTFRATTCADPAEYWTGIAANNLLLKNRRAVQAGVAVTRIFIHPAAMLPALRPAIEANRDAGVEVLFVDADTVHASLVRDFALCDDGRLGVELLLDPERRPERVLFYFPGPATAQISKLQQNWDALLSVARPVGELGFDDTPPRIERRIRSA
jgi:hypothetical protein